MIGTGRLRLSALCAMLCAAPFGAPAEEASPTPTEVEEPSEALQNQVDLLLQTTKAQLQEVEEQLFSEPDDPEMKTLAMDLRETIDQLEVLKAQLTESTNAC